MAVATAIVASVTQLALQNRRQVRVELQVRQAELLLEAGVHRAVTKLATQPSYPGETWQLETDTLPGFAQARVDITVTTDDATRGSQVEVTAQLDRGKTQRVRRSHTFVYRSTEKASAATADSRTSDSPQPNQTEE